MTKPFYTAKNTRGTTATIYNGNALDVLPMLRADGVLAVVTDPPYSSGGMFRGDRAQTTTDKYTVGGTRRVHPDFGGDNMDQRTYALWSREWMRAAFDLVPDGGVLLCFTDWRQLPTTTDAVQLAGFVWRGIIPWDKTPGVRPNMGCFRAQCEYVLFATRGGFKPFKKICAEGLVREHVHAATKEHIAQKPVEVMAHLLSILPEGATVVDPFMGSGSTGVAAVRAGINFIGIETDAHFCDVAARRIGDELEKHALI